MVIAILIFLIVALIFWDFWRRRVSFYRSVGAREIKMKFLLNPVGKIDSDGIEVEIFTEGAKGSQLLTLRAKTNLTGFLKLYRRNMCNRFFSQETFGGLGAEYEDSFWFERVLNHRNFKDKVEKLFKEGQVDQVSIRKHSLSVSWSIKKYPREEDRQKVIKTLPILRELLSLASELPDATYYKDHLRSWVIIKLPVLITLTLSLIGVLGKFYSYDPVCLFEILGVGYKLLFPFVILYSTFAVLLVGGRLWFKTFIVSFVAWLLAIPFISLFFLMYINGKLDTSPPEVKTDKVVEKYIRQRKGRTSYIVLEKLHTQKNWCNTLNVSENFYKKVQVGDTVEYITKRGFLGVEWFYRKLSIKYRKTRF